MVGSTEDKGKEEVKPLTTCQFYAWAAISVGDAKNLSKFLLVPAPSVHSDCSPSLNRRMGNEG